jgi:hypothetical protein
MISIFSSIEDTSEMLFLSKVHFRQITLSAAKKEKHQVSV